MTTFPHQPTDQLPPVPLPRMRPRRLAATVAEWVQSTIVILAWTMILFLVCGACYLLVRASLRVLAAAHQALGM